MRRVRGGDPRAGGIDFQILGIGKTGHIGFNEPGSGAESRTRLVHARRGDAPRRGRRLLRRGERAARGDHDGRRDDPRGARDRASSPPASTRRPSCGAPSKARSTSRSRRRSSSATRTRRSTSTARPAAELTRIATPWLLDEVEWTPELMVRAVVWLSQQAGKAILKLTQRDYAEHRLSSLVARYGSPGAVNGEVFNALGAKIRGKSQAAARPADHLLLAASGRRRDLDGRHPAQARRERERDHRRVHDERQHRRVRPRRAPLRRLPRRLAARAAASTRSAVDALAPTSATTSSTAKQPGRRRHPRGAGHQAHHPRDARRWRHRDDGARRRAPRASSTCRSIRRARCGRTRSARPTSRSCARCSRSVKPDSIFVAGDLSDPHGTHRMCKEAIDRALARARRRRRRRPEVWLYRGAWQEWPVTDATWLVPLSQEELRLKIQAIFKHQSQKDSAPFPGAGRARVLAARRGAQQGHGGGARPAGSGRVLRDGSVRRRRGER